MCVDRLEVGAGETSRRHADDRVALLVELDGLANDGAIGGELCMPKMVT
jgi:hypothetical protein